MPTRPRDAIDPRVEHGGCVGWLFPPVPGGGSPALVLRSYRLSAEVAMRWIWWTDEYVVGEGWRLVRWTKQGSSFAAREIVYDRCTRREIEDVMAEVGFDELQRLADAYAEDLLDQ